jgi:hypothetical protein
LWPRGLFSAVYFRGGANPGFNEAGVVYGAVDENIYPIKLKAQELEE